jgi:sarcosine oxidase subunit alpha
MITTEVLVIGGGPAGLCAAISAAKNGCQVILAERDPKLGGQLIKQTHMFFGSEKQKASERGIDIAKYLFQEIDSLDNLKVLLNTTISGFYEDGVVTADCNGEYLKFLPKTVIVATGAYEKSLAFPNNDLPGVYGAGAVQTLMNIHGVKPGKSVLMVGAGNIGLIVSYQLLQAGVKVQAILDAAPTIGGYLVHASKIRRMGVPILTGYSVKEALGDKFLEKAVAWQLDSKYNGIPGTEIEYDIDTLCISVGLSPLNELLWQVGCDMAFVNELGGYVPKRDHNNETSIPNVFIAGDVGGVEEASSAMVEGYLTGLIAAERAGRHVENFEAQKDDFEAQLHDLRSGPVGEKIMAGLNKTLL